MILFKIDGVSARHQAVDQDGYDSWMAPLSIEMLRNIEHVAATEGPVCEWNRMVMLACEMLPDDQTHFVYDEPPHRPEDLHTALVELGIVGTVTTKYRCVFNRHTTEIDVIAIAMLMSDMEPW